MATYSQKTGLHRYLMISAIVCWVAILIGTHIPNPHLPQMVTLQDKLLHILAYGTLTALAVPCWQMWPRPWVRFSYVLMFALMAVNAMIDELTQQLVPGRFAEFHDWVADMIGVLLGFVLAASVMRIFRSAAPTVTSAAGLRT